MKNGSVWLYSIRLHFSLFGLVHWPALLFFVCLYSYKLKKKLDKDQGGYVKVRHISLFGVLLERISQTRAVLELFPRGCSFYTSSAWETPLLMAPSAGVWHVAMETPFPAALPLLLMWLWKRQQCWRVGEG